MVARGCCSFFPFFSFFLSFFFSRQREFILELSDWELIYSCLIDERWMTRCTQRGGADSRDKSEIDGGERFNKWGRNESSRESLKNRYGGRKGGLDEEKNEDKSEGERDTCEEGGWEQKFKEEDTTLRLDSHQTHSLSVKMGNVSNPSPVMSIQ